MKKRFLLSVLLIMLISACQESPESDIIEQKVDNASPVIAAGDGTNGIANYTVPEKWQESVAFDNSDITVEIDAEVNIVENDTLSTYKIDESAGISQERVDILIDEFFGDAVIYDSNKELTRSEIEDMILRLKQQKAEAEAEPDSEAGERGRGNITFAFRAAGDGGGENGGQPQIINDRGAMFDRMIESYEEMLATAPESVEDKPLVPSVEDNGTDFVSFSGTSEVEGKGGRSISYMASKKNNLAPTLNITNSEYSLTETDDSEEQNAENAPSREDAMAAAEDLVARLGLSGMKISEVSFAKQIVRGEMFGGFSETEDTGKYGYVVKFSREVDGVSCIDGSANFGALNISGGRGGNEGGGGGAVMSFAATSSAVSFRRALGNEDLSIGITQDGIEEISWSGYFEVGDTVTQDVALLPFDEVQELFKKNMEITYTVSDTDERGEGQFRNFFSIENFSNTYNIYKAELCYTKTAIQNDSDNSMLVPVWAFYSYQVNEDGQTMYQPSPVLILNAIDGSVV